VLRFRHPLSWSLRHFVVDGSSKNLELLTRPVAETDDLDTAFSWQEERTVSGSLTLQYEKVLFLLRPSELTRSLARKRVTVHDFPHWAVRDPPSGPGLALPGVRQRPPGAARQRGCEQEPRHCHDVIKAKQARRGNMIAGSLAALAPAVGVPLPDRLGPVLAYVQTLQGQSEKKPGIAARRQTALRSRAAGTSNDIFIGEKL